MATQRKAWVNKFRRRSPHYATRLDEVTLRFGRDEAGAGVEVQVDAAGQRCPVEDPAPLAAALAEITASASAPALVLVDANGWLRRAFKAESDAAPDKDTAELAEFRRRPLEGAGLHH